MRKIIIALLVLFCVRGSVIAETNPGPGNWRWKAGSSIIITDGYLTVNGTTTFNGRTNLGMSSVVAVDTDTVLTLTHHFMLVVGSSNTADGTDTGAIFAVTVSTQPTSVFLATTTANNGDWVTLVGTSDTGTVTLTDGKNGLKFDGSSVTLGKWDNVTMFFDNGFWIANSVLCDID